LRHLEYGAHDCDNTNWITLWRLFNLFDAYIKWHFFAQKMRFLGQMSRKMCFFVIFSPKYVRIEKIESWVCLFNGILLATNDEEIVSRSELFLVKK